MLIPFPKVDIPAPASSQLPTGKRGSRSCCSHPFSLEKLVGKSWSPPAPIPEFPTNPLPWERLEAPPWLWVFYGILRAHPMADPPGNPIPTGEGSLDFWEGAGAKSSLRMGPPGSWNSWKTLPWPSIPGPFPGFGEIPNPGIPVVFLLPLPGAWAGAGNVRFSLDLSPFQGPGMGVGGSGRSASSSRSRWKCETSGKHRHSPPGIPGWERGMRSSWSIPDPT